jgi:hypothetical protein
LAGPWAAQCRRPRGGAPREVSCPHSVYSAYFWDRTLGEDRWHGSCLSQGRIAPPPIPPLRGPKGPRTSFFLILFPRVLGRLGRVPYEGREACGLPPTAQVSVTLRMIGNGPSAGPPPPIRFDQAALVLKSFPTHPLARIRNMVEHMAMQPKMNHMVWGFLSPSGGQKCSIMRPE